MHKNHAKDLFQLQTELVDTKVDMAVSKAIDRIIEQIADLKHEMHSEMHGLRSEMNKRFSSLEHRAIAVETKLGMVNETQKAVKMRVIDYTFRAGWFMLASLLSYFFIHFHFIVN